MFQTKVGDRSGHARERRFRRDNVAWNRAFQSEPSTVHRFASRDSLRGRCSDIDLLADELTLASFSIDHDHQQAENELADDMMIQLNYSDRWS